MTNVEGQSETCASERYLKKTIQSVYTSGNEALVHELTTLLVDALRNGNHCSRSALGDFFNLPVMSQPESQTPIADMDLPDCARLFINNSNAQRVENWISSYEMSAPKSERRSLYGKILRGFVSSRSEVEALKWQIAQAKRLAKDTRSKCDALESMIKNICRRA